jgi:hypothetical protein
MRRIEVCENLLNMVRALGGVQHFHIPTKFFSSELDKCLAQFYSPQHQTLDIRY